MFDAFHKLINLSNSTHQRDPLTSGNSHLIWFGQEVASFGIHHRRAGSSGQGLLGVQLGARDRLGPSYSLSLGHSDWFCARGGGVVGFTRGL